ncbi:MAG: outer membrane lipoprotein-sorting protein [bacterium]
MISKHALLSGFLVLSCGCGAFAEGAVAAAPETPAAAVAAGPSAHEILRIADEARGNLGGVKWMVDIDALDNGEHQTCSMNVSARGYDFLAMFLSPPKSKGQRVLQADRNMWYTKPGVRKPVPISSRQKLVGGAAYGDIAATDYANDYEPARLGDETVDGIACYVFDLKAKTKQTTYDRVKYWVSRDRGVGVRAEYYTVSGKMFKSARFEFDEKVKVDGVEKPFISRIIITDAVMSQNVTTMIFSAPQITKLPDSTFDANLLMSR